MCKSFFGYNLNKNTIIKKVSFKEEYLSFLKRNDIDYIVDSIFQFIDYEN